MMKILYFTPSCPMAVLNEATQGEATTLFSPAAFKFNRLMMQGLSTHCDLEAVVSNTVHLKLHQLTGQCYGEVCEENVKYTFLKLATGRLKYLKALYSNLCYIKEWRMGGKENILICDALCRSANIAILIASKLWHIKNVAIITDLPQYQGNLTGSLRKKVSDWMDLKSLNGFSGYVLLTEKMNDYVNHGKKPYCVIEGLTDAQSDRCDNTLNGKCTPKTVLYAGSLHQKYGIDRLIDGFCAAKLPNTQLCIYGEGDYKQAIVEMCKGKSNIQYRGIAPNEVIVREERQATLLVNPRPTHEEYTKYSFPSKNMEYMASGTPVLTTRLPSMPPEYNEHVYLIEEETADGLEKALRAVLSKSPEELHAKGLRAKEFVLREKNNLVQAGRLIEMIRRL